MSIGTGTRTGEQPIAQQSLAAGITGGAGGAAVAAGATAATGPARTAEAGWPGMAADMAGDRAMFRVPWGKAMMWIFLLSDTFIFGTFLTGYMSVRMSATTQ